MTWRELMEDIQKLDPRFLDTTVQVYNVAEDRVLIDAMLLIDSDDTDYVIDKDQPQIWVDFDDFNA